MESITPSRFIVNLLEVAFLLAVLELLVHFSKPESHIVEYALLGVGIGIYKHWPS